MNRRLRPLVFGSVTVALCSTTLAFACDKNHSSATNTTAAKTTTKSTTTKGTTATYAATSAQGSCSYKAGATTTAANTSSASCASKNTAVTANASKNTAVAASAGSACCASKGAKASNTTAAKTAATKGEASCHSEDASAAGFDAVLTGAGGQCNGKGVTTMAGRSGHSACDACSDMAMCEDELKTAGSQFQVVPLKNGVMYVYTANNSKSVHAVQAAIARRSERINSLVSATKANLCPDCKSMRGALASGKLTREVVNVEGGSISLVTSNDPTIVAKLYAMAGLENSKVVKS